MGLFKRGPIVPVLKFTGVIGMATPLRPGELSLPDRASEKPGIVRDFIYGFPPLHRAKLDLEWPGRVLAKNINVYVEALKGCLKGVENFDDKTYVTRLMDQFQPQYGYVDEIAGRYRR